MGKIYITVSSRYYSNSLNILLGYFFEYYVIFNLKCVNRTAVIRPPSPTAVSQLGDARDVARVLYWDKHRDDYIKLIKFMQFGYDNLLKM